MLDMEMQHCNLGECSYNSSYRGDSCIKMQ